MINALPPDQRGQHTSRLNKHVMLRKCVLAVRAGKQLPTNLDSGNFVVERFRIRAFVQMPAPV